MKELLERLLNLHCCEFLPKHKNNLANELDAMLTMILTMELQRPINVRFKNIRFHDDCFYYHLLVKSILDFLFNEFPIKYIT